MQSVTELLSWLEATPLAVFISESDWAFPAIEAVHVIALALVIGTIAIVDLRLLGVASAHRAYTELSKEVLPCTWTAFAVAVITGTLMFISHPVTYFENTAFRIKILLLLLAGANMLVFGIRHVARRCAMGSHAAKTPLAGKIAATLSLVFWVAVVFFGRRIGFTMLCRREAIRKAPDRQAWRCKMVDLNPALSSRRTAFAISAAVLAASILGLSLMVSAQDQSGAIAKDAIFARKILMDAIGRNMDELEGMTASAKAIDLAEGNEHADNISIMLMSFPHLFAANTNQWKAGAERNPGRDTYASPYPLDQLCGFLRASRECVEDRVPGQPRQAGGRVQDVRRGPAG